MYSIYSGVNQTIPCVLSSLSTFKPIIFQSCQLVSLTTAWFRGRSSTIILTALSFYIFIKLPGLSSHRYSVIFSADSEIFAFSAMFRAEPADFNFDISGHNWFSDEHFWTFLIQRWILLATSKQAKAMKKAKKAFFFNIDAEETRNRKFQNNFWWVNLKNSKNVIFPKSVFSSDSMAEDFLLEQKKWKIPKYLLQSRKKLYRS